MLKSNPINRVIDGISGIFLPLVNVMSAAGILKGLLALAMTTGFLPQASGTYQVLFAAADSLFFFLPVFLAFTAAQKFGANPYTAALTAAALLHPQMITLMKQTAGATFAGLPLTGVNYPASVIPILLAVGLLVFVERLFQKILPNVLKDFFTPLLSLLVTLPITLLVFGPLGTVIGDFLATAYTSAYSFSPILAGVCLGSLIQIMVIFGFHWSLVPLMINNIALNGNDTILALIGPAAIAQAGAALAVCLKTKEKSKKTLCFSAAISAIFGVTEPAIYAVNLPLKKPMLFVCIAGGIGGGIVGGAGSSAMSFAFPGLATLPVYLGSGFAWFIGACGIGFTLAFILTLLFGEGMEDGA